MLLESAHFYYVVQVQLTCFFIWKVILSIIFQWL